MPEFGRFLDDFRVGETYRHWPGKTITQAEDILFCAMTMNQHPLHSDDHYAANATSHGRAMVVGNFVYSIVLGQSVADISGRAIANLEVESLRHANPTFHGDTIYSESEVLEVRESKTKPDRGIVKVRTIGYTQDGTIVCEFVRSVLIPKRGFEWDGQPGRPSPRRE